MITKETSRQIYNCHQQLEEIATIKKNMLEEVEKIRKKRKRRTPPDFRKGFNIWEIWKRYAIGYS